MKVNYFRSVFVLMALSVILAGCATTKTDQAIKQERDAPPAKEVDVSQIPNAEPKVHTGQYKKAKYSLRGKTYYPMDNSDGYEAEGTASWYGNKFHGRLTANGEVYNMYAMTAAHKTLPLPTYLEVTNLENGRSIVVRVNDRGPFHGDRLIDLSWAAAKKLGYASKGTTQVKIRAITPKQGKTEIVEEKQAAKKDQPTSKGQFPSTVQVAALKSLEIARGLQNSLQKNIHQPVSVSYKKPYYKVRIGPVKSEKDYKLLQTKLKQYNVGKPLLIAG